MADDTAVVADDDNRQSGNFPIAKKIVDWVKSSKYKFGKHQCLEKAHAPGVSEEELILDLYCPIEEE